MPQEVARGTFSFGRPSNDHAQGFELALQVALDALREASPNLDHEEVEVAFHATVTVRNPADIDGYIVIISSLP